MAYLPDAQVLMVAKLLRDVVDTVPDPLVDGGAFHVRAIVDDLTRMIAERDRVIAELRGERRP
jgi:hypothetical protein